MYNLEVPVEFLDTLKNTLPLLVDYDQSRGPVVKSFTFHDEKYEAYFYKVLDHYGHCFWEYNPFKVKKTF
jgi:hypothetical protein